MHRRGAVAVPSRRRRCTVAAPSLYRRGAIAVPTRRRRCTLFRCCYIDAPSLHRRDIVSVLSLNRPCFIAARLMHRCCTISAPSLRRLCTVSCAVSALLRHHRCIDGAPSMSVAYIEGSARTWDGTGCKFDSWQCRIHIISHLHRTYDYSDPFGYIPGLIHYCVKNRRYSLVVFAMDE